MAPLRLAKLSPPRTGAVLVRDRLHRALDALAARGAVWVVGRGGAGKSVLAATWGLARGRRAFWYRCDEGDADAALAFSYFARLTGNRKGARALPAFSRQGEATLGPFAREFFRAFFETLPAASTLVIDDAHAAGGDFPELLAMLIREAPSDISLLVLSREDPPAALQDVIARGGLAVLDPALLAFTAEEAITLLGALPSEAARALHARTDGWVAGLVLLAQAGADRGPRSAPGTRALADLLAERMLGGFDPVALRDLSAASLLPEVDRATLERLGAGGGAALLETLARRQSFVVRLEREPAAWRLHDLLREALRARFAQVGEADWRARVRLAAATVAHERGLARDATQLFLDAGAPDRALALAESMARGLVAGQRTQELEAMVRLLPPEVVARSSVLQFALGELAWQRNDARAAVPCFEAAWAMPDASGAGVSPLLVAASALGAILEGWQDFEGAPRWAGRLQAYLGARASIASVPDGLRVDSICLRAAEMMPQEGNETMQAELAERLLEALSNRDPAINAEEALAASGVLVEYASYGAGGEQVFRRTALATMPWLANGRVAPLAEAGWLVTFLPVARRWPVPIAYPTASDPIAGLEHALDLARRHGGNGVAFSAALYLGYSAIAENDAAGTRKWFKAAQGVAGAGHPTQIVNVMTLEAGARALEGDWRGARLCAAQAIEYARKAGFPQSECWTFSIWLLRIDIATGFAGRAAQGLRALAADYPDGFRHWASAVVAEVADAGACVERGEAIPDVLVRSIMEQASARAWPGFATLLAPLAARLCSDALRLGIETRFATQVIRERRLPPPSAFESHWPWPIRIRALGGFEIEIEGEPYRPGARAPRKPLDLLRLLVAHGPEPVDAAVALDALWPDAEGGAARAAFDMTVMRLRKVLGREEALTLDAGRVGLAPATVWVDAWAYAADADTSYSGPLFGNDALAAWWAAARERLHQRFVRRTRETGRRAEAAGDHATALAAYESGLTQDPLAEEFYQGLIRTHLAAGRHADALRALRRCREQLSRGLGVAPSAATAALLAGGDGR